jgi:hypothetical protein
MKLALASASCPLASLASHRMPMAASPAGAAPTVRPAATRRIPASATAPPVGPNYHTFHRGLHWGAAFYATRTRAWLKTKNPDFERP